MGTEAGQPPEEVGIAAQLIELADVGVRSAEIGEEVAHRAAVGTNRAWLEGGAEGVDRAFEQREQGVCQRRTACAFHFGVTGSGRMCWATARAYCWYTSRGVTWT